MARQHRSSAAAGQGARHGRLRRSASWANALKVLLTGVIVFAISGLSVGAYAVWGLVKEANVINLGTAVPEASAIGAGHETLDGELNILLVGSDSRAGSILDDGEEGELNDVNLLLHVPADHKSATIISFPRDLMVPVPSCPGPNGEPDYYPAMSEQQLNSTMQYGGISCVAETISELAGVEVSYAAMVTFDGVINISNAIGGVEVCLAQPFNDDHTGLSLPAGNVSLEGLDALQFLRSRYGVGDGSDTSRISNQQVFMSALIRQMRSAQTLSNPVKVYGLAKAGFESLTLSSSMASVQFMQALAGTVVDIDLDRINLVQYPTFPHPYNPGRLTPDHASADALMSVVLSGEPFQVGGMGSAAVEAPGTEPVEGEAPTDGTATDGTATDGTATDGTATDGTATAPPGVVVLPENVKGQSAADQTCSAGRTVY